MLQIVMYPVVYVVYDISIQHTHIYRKIQAPDCVQYALPSSKVLQHAQDVALALPRPHDKFAEHSDL